jgi:hypothetical protein
LQGATFSEQEREDIADLVAFQALTQHDLDDSQISEKAPESTPPIQDVLISTTDNPGITSFQDDAQRVVTVRRGALLDPA